MITHEEHVVALQKQEAYWRERLDEASERHKKSLMEQNDLCSKLMKALSDQYEGAVVRSGVSGLLFGAFLVMLLRYVFGG